MEKEGRQPEDKKLIGKALKVAGVAVDLSGEGEMVVSATSGGGGGGGMNMWLPSFHRLVK